MGVRRWCVRVAVVLAVLSSTPGYATPSDPPADLALAVAASGPAVPGEPLTWTVTVTNHGPPNAEGVILTEVLKLGPGEVVTSALSALGPCTVKEAATVACELGTLDAGAAVRVTVGQSVAADRTDPPSVRASVAANGSDPATADQSAADHTATLHPIADLWLTGSVAGPDAPGGPVTLSWLVTNDGPTVIPAGTKVSATLPAPVTYAPAGSASGCTAAGHVVTCVLDRPVPIGPRNAAALVIRGTAATSAALPYPATVTPPAGITDPEPDNNQASAASPGIAQADVAIVVSGPTEPVAAGTTAAFTYTVTNRGPAEATGVAVTGVLPSGVGFESSTNGCTAADQAVTCPPVPALAAGETATFALTVAVDADQAAGTAMLSGKVAAAAPGDPNGSNQTGYAPVPVVRRANLSLDAHRSAGPLTDGGPVTYELTVHNFGPASATGVTVTDRLPVEVVLGSATVPDGTCTVAGALHTCTLTAPLAADASAVVTVTGTVNSAAAGATLTDTAFASADEPEADLADNGTTSIGVIEGRAAPVEQDKPITSAVRGAVALGSRLAWWTWAGAGTVVFGLILLVVAVRRHPPTRPGR